MLSRPIARVAFAAIVVLAPFWPAVAAATNNTGTTTTTTTSTTTTVPETTTTSTTTTIPDTVPSQTTTTEPATTVVEETSTTSTAPPTTTTVPPETTTPTTIVVTIPPPCPEGMFPSTSAGDLPCLPEDPCTSTGFTVWHFQPCTLEQPQPPPTTTTIPSGTRMLPATGREIETILLIGLALAAVGLLVVWACSRQFDDGEWQ